MRSGLTWLIVVGCSTVLVAAACGDDGNESSALVEDAEAEVCGSFSDLDAAVEEAKDLDSSSSVRDALEAFEKVRVAFNDLMAIAGKVPAVRLEELEAAALDFRTAVAGLTGTVSLGRASTTIHAEVSNLGKTVVDTRSELRCP